MCIKRLLLAGLLTMLAHTAQAGVVSFSDQFEAHVWSNYVTWQSVYGGISGTGYGGDVASLARFDASLGTLTGVQITLDSGWILQQIVRAKDTLAENGVTTAAAAITSDSSFKVFLTDPYGPQIFGVSASMGYTSCSQVVAGNFAQCEAYDISSNNPFDAVYTVDPSQVWQFVGLNPIDLTLSQTTTVSGACNYHGSFDAGDDCTGSYNDSLWGGTLTVTYTYDDAPVPAPPPGLLFMGGLLLLGLRKVVG